MGAKPSDVTKVASASVRAARSPESEIAESFRRARGAVSEVAQDIKQLRGRAGSLMKKTKPRK
jgi:hypothetical protein